MPQKPDPDQIHPDTTVLFLGIYKDAYWGGHSIQLDLINDGGVQTMYFTQDETQALIERLQLELHKAKEADL